MCRKKEDRIKKNIEIHYLELGIHSLKNTLFIKKHNFENSEKIR